MINKNDTVYLSSGTAQELIAHYIDSNSNIRIITNSLPVFKSWKNKNIDLILVGGNFQQESEIFTGELTNNTLRNLKFDKSFVSVAGIYNENMTINSIEEGISQKVAINNSITKIALADCFKINHADFYHFYSLYDIDYLITNVGLKTKAVSHYQQYTQVILADKIK